MRILITFILGLLIGITVLKPVSAFDHMTCQYPTRQSNPADGCDNSDPACVEEIKGGVCPIEEPTPTPTPTPIVQPEPSPEPPKNVCS